MLRRHHTAESRSPGVHSAWPPQAESMSGSHPPPRSSWYEDRGSRTVVVRGGADYHHRHHHHGSRAEPISHGGSYERSPGHYYATMALPHSSPHLPLHHHHDRGHPDSGHLYNSSSQDSLGVSSHFLAVLQLVAATVSHPALHICMFLGRPTLKSAERRRACLLTDPR